ncbi:GAF and HD-GYP domain-containing protein [Thermus filiformis]|uniref:Phosphohydrolase n=1 Tax=Thermus filiformis TaxID=276 RepID=A0A0D6X962_THEFI|nr:HD domain-containing phosphohydrolase [Thermus filiformis]KIX84454.1 phosphohydrolase [Thermus filiformis]
MRSGPKPKNPLQTLSEAFRLLAPLRRREEAFQAVVRAAKAQTRASSVLLFLVSRVPSPEGENRERVQEVQEVLELVAAEGPAREQVGLRLREGEGVCWTVLRGGEPLYLPDTSECGRWVFRAGTPSRGAYLGVPVRDPEGRPVGVLSLDTGPGEGEVLPEDRFWLEALAEALGLTLGRLEALERAEEEARRAKALYGLSLALEGALEPKEMVREALNTLLLLTPYHAGGFYRFREDAARPEVLVGRYPPHYPRLYEEHPVRFGEGLLGHPGLWEGPVYVEDYARFPGALGPYREAGLRTSLLVPVRPGGRRYGVLALASFHRVVPYRPEDEALLKAVAHRLEEALERRMHLELLQNSREAALKALARALEYRDLETHGHTERVARLAVRLGEALGFPDLEGLRLGAYFHDLGKLAVPDEILHKDAPLNTREWRVVKTHPEVGHEILKTLPFFSATALNVVLYHHERWDGSGYPFGLKGEAIPREARIFAVVDVYDALISQRPYKRAWSEEEALEELRAQANRTLDPEAVAAFLALRLLPEGNAAGDASRS